jgi:hypothetical protein
MRLTLIVLTLVSVGCGAIAAETWPKIRTNSDGSQVYQYQKGTTCIKQADYATERTVSGKASIKQAFSAEGSSSQKVVDALAYSPSVSAVHAALFDVCTAYGSGATNKQQYEEERKALQKLQNSVIEKEAGQSLTVPQKTVPSQDPSNTKSGSESPKEGSGSKSSQPAGTETKTNEAKPQSTEVNTKGESTGNAQPKSSAESPREGSDSNSSKTSETKTNEAKPQGKVVNGKGESAENTQPSGTASVKNEPTNAKPVQPPNPSPTPTVPPQPPFPGGRDFSFNLKATCSSRDPFDKFDYEKTLPVSLSFKANGRFESITQTCHGQASTASGSWKRVGHSISISAIVNNQTESFYCTVVTGDKLSCSHLVALVPSD